MLDIREYTAPDGNSPFARWFDRLNAEAAAKVAVALTRMQHSNLSNVKAVASGVHEYRIDFGPGYRVYFGRDGPSLIILLGGGAKKRQQNDIQRALELWAAYKIRKRKET